MSNGSLSLGSYCATALGMITLLAEGMVASAAGAPTPRGSGEASAGEGRRAGLAIDPFVAGRVLDAQRLIGFKAGVAHRIFTAEEGGAIAIAVLAVPLPTDGPKARVQVFVEIDGATFLSHNQAAEPWVEVYVYAVGAQQAVAGHLADAFRVDVSELAETLSGSGLKLYGRLELSPGSYDLRVLVRNRQTGADGTRIVPLRVPESGALHLLPLFAEPGARWLAIRSTSLRVGLPYPFVVDGRSLSPASRPVIAQGREAELVVFCRDLPPTSLSGHVQFLTPEGVGSEASPPGSAGSGAGEPRVVAEARIDSIESGEVPEQRLDRLTIRFRPPQLSAGEYPIRLRLREPSGRRLESTPAKVWLLAGDVRERDLLWTDLRWMIAGSGPPAAVPAAVERPAGATAEPRMSKSQRPSALRGRRARRVAARYRATLEVWSEQPLIEARAALFELESEILGRGQESLDVLRAAEVAVAAELARQRVESLLPLCVLHLEIYRLYRGRRLHSLTAHSRSLIEHLADLYVEHGGDRAIAADVLASLAGELQAADQTASSQRLFQRVLEHYPSHRAALLALAISFERHGKSAPAIEVLERLVEAHPDIPEGRLRLAINLDRIGLKRRSLELLEGIVAAPAAAWVKSLAYQELARRHLETGGFEPAAKLLSASIEAAPQEQAAHLLLAYVHDRLRQPWQALRVLETIRPRAGNGDSSAAKRYDSWPRSTLEASRRALAEAAEGHRPALAGILSDSIAD